MFFILQNKEMEDEQNNNNNRTCLPISMPCWKFFIASIISLGTTGFACALLFIDKFNNTALTSFATSTIASNIAFWCEPPSVKDKID